MAAVARLCRSAPLGFSLTASGRWTVVGVSTAVNALAWGARSTFALFYVAMLEEFAWGRGPTALPTRAH